MAFLQAKLEFLAEKILTRLRFPKKQTDKSSRACDNTCSFGVPKNGVRQYTRAQPKQNRAQI
jgi:hypothetical protein